MTYTINVDLHCHTVTSKDSTIKLDDLITQCDRKGIAKIAITDHNRINGALEAFSRWPGRIIPGIEIMTSQGELLAYYVRESVPTGLSPIETITTLKAQGALVSVSHPFDRFRNGGWKTPLLLELLPKLDAIEIFNSHCFSDKPNQQAESFANKYRMSGTAGTDAHSIFEIGLAGLTLHDFNDSQGLRQALQNAKVFGRRSNLGMRILSRLLRIMR
ncbi:MAG: PHP domain-containing protein [Anaerolineaceae bacterium]